MKRWKEDENKKIRKEKKRKKKKRRKKLGEIKRIIRWK